MNHDVLLIVNFLLVIIEATMGVLLAVGFFSKRYSGSVWWICVALLLIAWWTLVYLFEENTIAKIILTIAAFSVWIKLVFKTSLIKGLFTAVFLFAYFYTVDVVSMMLFELIAGSKINLYDSPYSFYLFAYSTKIISLLGIVIIRTWAKTKFHRQAATWTDWLRSLLFPISSLILVVSLLHMYYLNPSLASEVLICSVILLVTNVVSVLILNQLEKQQSAIRDNAILQKSIKLERDNISAWMEAYSGQRKQTHDFQNQLLALRGMVEVSSKQEEIIRYLDQLIKVELPTSLFVNTHRSVVDVILNQKYAIAKSKQITFDTRLDDLSSFALPDDALVIVLSNLIDNAIEACERIENPAERRILLKMQVSPESSFLYIENSTNQPVQIHDNRVITTKSDPMSHGYGLQNVSAMLKRHDAVYAIDYKAGAGVFCFSTQITSPAPALA